MTADGHAPFAATSSASKIALLPTRELVYPVAGTSLVDAGGDKVDRVLSAVERLERKLAALEARIK